MRSLYAFAGLVMCCSAVSALLPEGGMKRTAALVMGLTVLAMWAGMLRDELPEALPELWDGSAPAILEHIDSSAAQNSEVADENIP